MTDVVDSLVHHAWASQLELMEFMSPGWREFLGQPGSLPDAGGAWNTSAFAAAGVMPALPANPYRDPDGDKRAGTRPASGAPPGSDVDLLRTQVLDEPGVTRAVLAFDAGALAPAHPNPWLALEVVRAANDWSIARWLSGQDDRFYGLVLAPNQLPNEAAAEVRRAGAHPRMVGVLMGGNGMARPFGHPVYHPIYEAAHELGLPVVIAAGGDSPPDNLSHPTAAGLPATYAEYRVLGAGALMSHLVSMVAQGVFERFPGLRVVLAGGGFTWLPSVLFRFDTNFKALRREVPWLRDLPSEYVRRHVLVSAQPLDGAPVDGLQRLLSTLPWLSEVLCFASGYPDRDLVTPDDVRRLIPPKDHAAVLGGNAMSVFAWPDRPATGAGVAGESVGAMPATGL